MPQGIPPYEPPFRDYANLSDTELADVLEADGEYFLNPDIKAVIEEAERAAAQPEG